MKSYAGFAKRVGAFVLDWLVIAAYILILTVTTLGVISILQYTGHEIMFPSDPIVGNLIAFTTLVLPVAPTQPTPFVIAGFALVYVLIGLFALSILVSKTQRAPYDWATGSYVVEVVRHEPMATILSQ